MNKISSEKKACSLIEEFEQYLTPTLVDKGVNIAAYAKKIFDNGTILTYKENQGIIGYYLDEETKSCFISILAVRPKKQREGIGKALIEKVMAEAKENKCETIKLAVEKTNSRGIRFYERAGFTYLDETDIQYLLTMDL
jgi:ribosomal protein S18 acetylase RimI-like enzyme